MDTECREVYMTTEAKILLLELSEKEKETALEIIKKVDSLELSRASKIFDFCKVITKNTAKVNTKKLFFS